MNVLLRSFALKIINQIRWSYYMFSIVLFCCFPYMLPGPSVPLAPPVVVDALNDEVLEAMSTWKSPRIPLPSEDIAAAQKRGE